MFSTDPAARQAFINSLHALADYLARQPGIPVPTYGTTILLHLDGADHGGRQQVDYMAAETVGSPVQDDSYETHRDFDPVAYGRRHPRRRQRPGTAPRTPTGDASPPTR